MQRRSRPSQDWRASKALHFRPLSCPQVRHMESTVWMGVLVKREREKGRKSRLRALRDTRPHTVGFIDECDQKQGGIESGIVLTAVVLTPGPLPMNSRSFCEHQQMF